MKSHPLETAIELILPALFRVGGDHQASARSAADSLMHLIDVQAFQDVLIEAASMIDGRSLTAAADASDPSQMGSLGIS